jgi:hypothetical protein
VKVPSPLGVSASKLSVFTGIDGPPDIAEYWLGAVVSSTAQP